MAAEEKKTDEVGEIKPVTEPMESVEQSAAEAKAAPEEKKAAALKEDPEDKTQAAAKEEPKWAVKEEPKSAAKEEPKPAEKAEERVLTLPLRDAWKSARSNRTKAAISVLKKQLKKHFRQEPKIDKSLNEAIWAHGLHKPPRRIQVRVRKTATELLAFPVTKTVKKQ